MRNGGRDIPNQHVVFYEYQQILDKVKSAFQILFYIPSSITQHKIWFVLLLPFRNQRSEIEIYFSIRSQISLPRKFFLSWVSEKSDKFAVIYTITKYRRGILDIFHKQLERERMIWN